MRKFTMIVLLVLLAALTIGWRPANAQTWTRPILGDVNRDGKSDSTDFLIIMSADVGMSGTARFCPMNCGDVNLDGFVNSTDGLIILIYDVGLPVPYPVGARWCPSPSLVRPPPGCFVP